MPNWKKLIVSGSDAHLSSLDISGALTASSAYLTSASIGHLQTIYETASVIYSSGSTKFGDTLDDTHEITGSLLVNGSISGTGSFKVSDHLIPTSDETYDLGSPTNKFRDLYLSGSTIYLGDTKLSEDSDGNLEVRGNNGNLKKIVTDELILGSGASAQRIKINNGRLATTDRTSGQSTAVELALTASHAITASHALNVPDTASHALTSVTSSHSTFASSGDGVFTGSFSGSFIGDASNLAINPFPFTGSGEMQGQLVVESFNDYIDDYVESYFAGTAIASNGDIALTGSIFGAYQHANSFTGSFLNDTGYVVLTEVSTSLNFTNDTDAANAGVPLGGLYRNGNTIQIRIS